jgi:hypothetical protein
MSKTSADDVVNAARALIGLVRGMEKTERQRSSMAELTLDVKLTSGETETWTITIERMASTH